MGGSGGSHGSTGSLSSSFDNFPPNSPWLVPLPVVLQSLPNILPLIIFTQTSELYYIVYRELHSNHTSLSKFFCNDKYTGLSALLAMNLFGSDGVLPIPHKKKVIFASFGLVGKVYLELQLRWLQ